MKKFLIALMAVSSISMSALANDGHEGGKYPPKMMPQHHKVMAARGNMQDCHFLNKQFMKNLSEKKQEAVKKIIKEYSMKEAMKDLLEARRKIIVAEVFDTDAFLKNAQEILEAQDKMKDNRLVIEAKILLILDKAEREKLVEMKEKKISAIKEGKGPKGKK